MTFRIGSKYNMQDNVFNCVTRHDYIMEETIFISPVFISIGILLIIATNRNYPVLFDLWYIKLLKRIAGNNGVIVFYYIIAIIFIMAGTGRIIYFYLK